MFALRTLGHALLALALIVNVELPLIASGADHAAHHSAGNEQVTTPPAPAVASADAAPCHGSADASVLPSGPSTPMDCCDGAVCSCSCLHHAPVAVLSGADWVTSPYRWVAQLGRLVSVPAAPSAPAIRPPIV